MTRFLMPALLCFANTAAAADIDWRTDYKAARKEAAETGKPLLLDFGTEACTFCRKLDATTFRDASVAKRLGDFIPVKIDGHADRRLGEALDVTAYPTLVIATPEGKVVARHSGYLDAKGMLDLLGKAPVAAKEKGVGADLDALYPQIAAALNR